MAGKGLCPFNPLAAGAAQKKAKAMAKEKLDARAAFRLPSDVLKKWHSEAKESGSSLSDFLRRCVDKKYVTGLPTPASVRRKRDTSNYCDPELIRQLAQIGNNLNQIARVLNQHHRSSKGDVQTNELLTILRCVRKETSELYPKLPIPRPPNAH